MIRIKPGKIFFNAPKVLRAVDDATRKVFSKFGAYVMTRSRRSIRKPPKKAKGGASRPGRPPYSHTGALKKFIFFGYDFKSRSVVIGPTKLSVKNTNAPETLEYGGKATIGKGQKRKDIIVEARPYMGPAYEKEKPKLPGMWADSVK